MRVRNLILFAYLSLLIFGGACQDGGGGPSCGSVNDFAADYETEASLDGPLDLPVTIAKDEIGVDAETIDFQAISSSTSSLVKYATSTATTDTSETIGTLFFYLEDKSCGKVAVMVYGGVLDVAESNPITCQLSYEVREELADVDIALAALADGAYTTDDGLIIGNASFPIALRINSPDSTLITEYSITVMGSILSTSNTVAELAYKMGSTEMGFLNLDGTMNIIFPATDSNGNELLLSMLPRGKFVEPFATAPHNPTMIETLPADPTVFYGIDNTDNKILLFNTDGLSDSLNLSSLDKSGAAQIRVHSSGELLAYTATMTNVSTGNPTKTLGIHDLAAGKDLGPITLSETSDLSSFTFDWVNNYKLVVLSQVSGQSSYRVHLVDVDGFIDDQTTTLDMELVHTSTKFIGNPVAGGDQKNLVYYVCEQDDGVRDLCVFDNSTDKSEIIVSTPYSINTNYRLSKNDSFIAFEVQSSPPTLGVFIQSTKLTHFLTRGENPTPSPSNEDFMAFQGTLAATKQPAFLNVGHNATVTPSSLGIDPATPTVATSHAQNFLATGGVPPYTFSLASGSGTVNKLSGRYVAPSSGGEAVVKVTDGKGNNATANITIPSPGTADTQLDKDGVADNSSSTPQGSDTSPAPTPTNTNGVAQIDVSALDDAWDITILSSGKYIIGGSTGVAGKLNMLLLKVNNDGTLSSSFGDGGKAILSVGANDDEIKAIAIQSDGKIIAAGYRMEGTDKDATVVRFNLDGSVDTTFATNGIYAGNFGTGNSEFSAVKVLPTGKIIAAGSAVNKADDFLVARFNTGGGLDTTFGTNGSRTYDFSGLDDLFGDMIVQLDGNIVIAGSAKIAATEQFALKRINEAGQLDLTFGNKGNVTLNIGTKVNKIEALHLLKNGSLLAAGFCQNTNLAKDFCIAKFKASGNVDLTFGDINAGISGGEGRSFLNTSSDDAIALGVDVQSDGKIVLVGSTHATASKLNTVRLITTGVLDTSFSDDGMLQTAVGDNARSKAVLIENVNGRISATGFGGTNANPNVVLHRLWP